MNEIKQKIREDFFERYLSISLFNDVKLKVNEKDELSTIYNIRIAKIFKNPSYFVVSNVDEFNGHVLKDRRYMIVEYDKYGKFVGEIKNFNKIFYDKLIFIK